MSKMNLEILAYEDTPLGVLCLRRREILARPGTFVTEVTLNHEFLMSSLYTDSERALTRIAIEMHAGDELNVLVGGLGLGYTAHEALKSNRVSRVNVVELLPQVVGWMKEGLVPLSEELMREQRLSITPDDVYKRLAREPGQGNAVDVILIDVDHSPDDRLGGESQPFYTERGLVAAKSHLAKDGVLAVWSYAESSPFADALRNTFEEVRVEGVTHLNELIDEEHTDWLFFAR